MRKLSTPDEIGEARTQLKSVLEALTHALQAEPMDWAAANVLVTDFGHLYEPSHLRNTDLVELLDQLRRDTRLHRPFDRMDVVRRLETLLDTIAGEAG